MEKLNEETRKVMEIRFGKDSIIGLATVNNGMPEV